MPVYLLALTVPAVFAVLACTRYRYAYSFFTTAACLATVLLACGLRAPYVAGALAASLVGDYFMAHKKGNTSPLYVLGVAGFCGAHGLYLMHALSRFRAGWAVYAGGALLALGYGYYFFALVAARIENPALRVAGGLYVLLSVAVMTVTFGYAASPLLRALYTAGIALLLFSDTMIAENDFRGRRQAEKWILPTYYAAQVMISAAAILQ